ncbi:MAG: Fic family protein [Chloroflexi bacterium]|nr:Fic family protein [Chloroflexota bacterium]MBM3152102.1 Fic family protein [Chloroflexota bacterium]
MNPQEFSSSSTGKAIRTQKGYWAFLPAPLPPEINWSANLVSLVGEAERALGELSWVGQNFSEPHVMVRAFVRQEAVMSSRIEGTRASLDDVYQYEAEQLSFLDPNSDVREVHNYVTALNYGIARLASLPVSLRLIRELHQHLMEGVRGDVWKAGEFRQSQNWIGAVGSTLETATYVPPPVDELMEALGQLEGFIHAASDLPPLVRAGLIHYQFEAIHPFLDGNGRVGRLLILLLFCQWKLLPQPLLYLSGYFEKNRSEYYNLLLAVSQRGKWEEWLSFFLTGVREQSHITTRCVQDLQGIREKYYRLHLDKRDSIRLNKLVDYLLGRPIVTIKQVQADLGLTDYKIAQRYISKLQEEGLLREMTGKTRNRLFRADEILKAIESS